MKMKPIGSSKGKIPLSGYGAKYIRAMTSRFKKVMKMEFKMSKNKAAGR